MQAIKTLIVILCIGYWTSAYATGAMAVHIPPETKAKQEQILGDMEREVLKAKYELEMAKLELRKLELIRDINELLEASNEQGMNPNELAELKLRKIKLTHDIKALVNTQWLINEYPKSPNPSEN